MALERPLYLQTLEEKVGREGGEVTFLSPLGAGVSLRKEPSRAVCVHCSSPGAVDSGDDGGRPKQGTCPGSWVLGPGFWEPAVQPGQVEWSAVHTTGSVWGMTAARGTPSRRSEPRPFGGFS